MIKQRDHSMFDTKTQERLDLLFGRYAIFENWAEQGGEKDYQDCLQAYRQYLDAKREAFAKLRAQ